MWGCLVGLRLKVSPGQHAACRGDVLGLGADCARAPGVLLGSGCGLHVSRLHSRIQLIVLEASYTVTSKPFSRTLTSGAHSGRAGSGF